MNKHDKEFHDRLYQESLGPRRKVMTVYRVSRQARERFYNLISQYARDGVRILDYGCGRGDLSFYLAEKGATVVGIDISQEAIRQAQDRMFQTRFGGRVEFFVMDAHNTEFPDNSFDVVCGISIIHHLDIDQAYR